MVLSENCPNAIIIILFKLINFKKVAVSVNDIKNHWKNFSHNMILQLFLPSVDFCQQAAVPLVHHGKYWSAVSAV